MSMRFWSAIGGLGLFALAAPGCHHHRHDAPRHAEADADRDHDEAHDEHSEPRLLAGPANRSAVRSIASARCEREQRCGNIGAERDYASLDVCEEKVRADWNDDLNKYECPNGVVDSELDECLTDIRSEDCNNPFDALARITSCSAGDICDQ